VIAIDDCPDVNKEYGDYIQPAHPVRDELFPEGYEVA
jgi:hypothetical protein